MLQKFIKKERGFTLIELLVVIAIIGILATVVMVAMGDARLRARNMRRMADMRAVFTAQSMHYGTYGHFVQSAAIPGNIGVFLIRMPVDPIDDPPHPAYVWINNTGAVGAPTPPAGISASRAFCFFADLEDAGYVAASQAGVHEVATTPTLAVCW